ncbi:uncharacterized protein VTP21DRAFT_4315 [Calcarisporiella thermophila]|uniref:uncharacterized protein n=1 Tax=Calcarisporiella thermophila TaxID=911321 RepID=UPI0037423106
MDYLFNYTNTTPLVTGSVLVLSFIYYCHTRLEIINLRFVKSRLLELHDALSKQVHGLYGNDENDSKPYSWHFTFFRHLKLPTFCYLWLGLIAASITLSLQLLFIRKFKNLPSMQQLHVPFSFLVPVSMLLAFFPDVMKLYTGAICGRKKSKAVHFRLAFCCIGFACILACTLYSVFTLVKAFSRVGRDSRNQKANEVLEERHYQLFNLIRKIMLYPLALLISQPFYFIAIIAIKVLTAYLRNEYLDAILIWSALIMLNTRYPIAQRLASWFLYPCLLS